MHKQTVMTIAVFINQVTYYNARERKDVCA
jgi:hypothetical protein